MADRNETVTAEDILPVKSRISWGPIFAGATVGLATYLLLTLLGAAIGLSTSDSVRDRTFNVAAVLWAVITTMACLYWGGWVSSHYMVGENRSEALLNGMMVWAVVFVALLWMAASGVQSGFNAMIGVSNVAAQTSAEGWENAARKAGVPEEKLQDYRRSIQNAPANIQAKAEDPATREQVANSATKVAWYTFAGTLFSMLAAMLGAYMGAGPNFRLFVDDRAMHSRRSGSPITA